MTKFKEFTQEDFPSETECFNTQFEKCNFNGVIFRNYIFDHTRFFQCEFINCVFINCIFQDGFFVKCTFNHNLFYETTRFKEFSFVLNWFSSNGFYDDIHITNSCHIEKNKILNTNKFPSHIEKLLAPIYCPEFGPFLAYKIAEYKDSPYLILLHIPADALRSSAQGNKCRASKATVIDIMDLNGKSTSSIPFAMSPFMQNELKYTIGKTIEIKDFNKNRWEECAEGIHFFMTPQEAIQYYNYIKRRNA